MAAVQMVVVNGVRYRPEDAPKQVATATAEPRAKARKPANKSRTAQDK